MKPQEKKALEILKQEVADFKKNQQHDFLFLMQDKEFKKLHFEENSLIIEISKDSEKNQKNIDNLKKIEKNMKKIAKKHEIDYQKLKKEHFCDKCNDTGFVDGKTCECLKKIMSNLAMKQNSLIIKTPKQDFSLFNDSKKIQITYSTLETWAKKFESSPIKNWGFFGATGTGKTHLMLTVAKMLIDDGYFVVFSTAFNLNREMLSQHTDFDDKNRDYMAKYIDCDVLFIDDLGTEPTYQNVTENYLYLICNQRMIEEKPTIFSTNLTLGEFEEKYGERIFSRLISKKSGKILLFDEQDLRLKKL